MSHLLDRLTFFRQKKEQFSDGHGVTTAEARDLASAAGASVNASEY